MTKDSYNVSIKTKEAEALKDVEGSPKEVASAPFIPSTRLTLSIIGFFMFFHLYAQRIGMSVAIVRMVNQTAVRQLSIEQDLAKFAASDAFFNESLFNGTTADYGRKSSAADPQCVRQVPGENSTASSMDGPFIWPKSIQGHILGAFFYGYLVSQIPGGLLAERFGGKWVITGFLGLSTLATLLTPVASRIGFPFLIILRVLCGIGSGGMYPAMHAMLGHWAPPSERTKICGFIYAGAPLGNVVTLPIAGFLCQYGFDDGWGSVFYIIGITSAVTIVFWVLLTSSSPTQHPRISSLERNYIYNSLKDSMSEKTPTLCEMPWGKIITSGPVWALIIANFCVDWGLYTFLTNIPTFYNEVLLFDITANGMLSAVPFLGLWFSMTFVPVLADKIQAIGVLRPLNVRRLFNTFGMVVPAIFLIALSFVDCTQTPLAVTLLVLSVTILGAVYSGYFVNHMDIAPKYAGTLMGVANGLAAASGFIAPAIAAELTQDGSRESWQKVFFIAAAVFVFGAFMYAVLARGTVQPWALDRTEQEMELTVEEKPVNGKTSPSPIYKPRLSNGTMEDAAAAEVAMDTKA